MGRRGKTGRIRSPSETLAPFFLLSIVTQPGFVGAIIPLSVAIQLLLLATVGREGLEKDEKRETMLLQNSAENSSSRLLSTLSPHPLHD